MEGEGGGAAQVPPMHPTWHGWHGMHSTTPQNHHHSIPLFILYKSSQVWHGYQGLDLKISWVIPLGAHTSLPTPSPLQIPFPPPPKCPPSHGFQVGGLEGRGERSGGSGGWGGGRAPRAPRVRVPLPLPLPPQPTRRPNHKGIEVA